MSTRSSVLTTRTADLVLCLMSGLESTLTYALPVWPNRESNCRNGQTLCRNVFLSSLLSALPLHAIRSLSGLAEPALLYPSRSCPSNGQQDPTDINCCKPQAAEKPTSTRWEGLSFWLCTEFRLLENRPRTRSRQQKSSYASLTASLSPCSHASVSHACSFPAGCVR
jgi:hypothetical protein